MDLSDKSLSYAFLKIACNEEISGNNNFVPFVGSYRIESLKESFDCCEAYISRFYPLFLIEAVCIIAKATVTETSLSASFDLICADTDNDYITLSFGGSDANYVNAFTKKDLIQIAIETRNTDKVTTSTKSPGLDNENSKLPICIKGIVDAVSRDESFSVRILIPPASNCSKALVYKCSSIAESIQSPSSHRWRVTRIINLASILREYKALLSFGNIELRKELLNSVDDEEQELKNSLAFIYNLKNQTKSESNPTARARLLQKLHLLETSRINEFKQTKNKASSRDFYDILDVPHCLLTTLESFYNASQFNAIKDSAKTRGVTLIQGPPGTGKTTTILGIISMILHSSIRRVLGNDGATNSNLISSAEQEQPVSNEKNDGKYYIEPTALLKQSQPWIYDQNFRLWNDGISILEEDLDEKYKRYSSQVPTSKINVASTDIGSQPRRLLVCSPSNAAIDEVLKRLVMNPEKGGGLFNAGGIKYTPVAVRVGPNVHPDLIQYSLDCKIRSRMEILGRAAQTVSKKTIEIAILREAEIVCSTLSICGSKTILDFPDGFDTIIIDEASQSVEPATLIPLNLGCRRLILVGDPKQLPPTVFSQTSILHNYSQSLFQRLERAGCKINMLSSQYRMHPKIAAFTSLSFYDGLILNSDRIEEFVRPPIPYYSIPMFSPIVFFSMESEEWKGSSSSFYNIHEAYFVCEAVDLLQDLFRELCIEGTVWTSRVAIITPYLEQVRLIRKLLKILFHVDGQQSNFIDVNTVDGFQGQEKDIVIFSAVRAQSTLEDARKMSIGFLADKRRMNVALTRARMNLWIVGHENCLRQNDCWARFCDYAHSNNYVIQLPLRSSEKKSGYLKEILRNYVDRVLTAKSFFEEYVPGFIRSLTQTNNLQRTYLEFTEAQAKELASST